MVVITTGFNKNNIDLCKMSNCNLASSYCQQLSKGGVVANFVRQSYAYLSKGTNSGTGQQFHIHQKIGRFVMDLQLWTASTKQRLIYGQSIRVRSLLGQYRNFQELRGYISWIKKSQGTPKLQTQ